MPCDRCNCKHLYGRLDIKQRSMHGTALLLIGLRIDSRLKHSSRKQIVKCKRQLSKAQQEVRPMGATQSGQRTLKHLLLNRCMRANALR